MELDPRVLSPVKFAFVVSFRASFSVVTIGLASYIALLHGLFLKTKKIASGHLALLWATVFAAVFGLSVATIGKARPASEECH